MDALPVTAHGKIDRARLPWPPPDPPPPGALPATPIAQAVARAFAEVLGRGRLDIHANFFDLGGSSLTLVEVQKRLEDELGREVPLVSLLQYPTASTLAEYLAGELAGAEALDSVRRRAERRRAAAARRPEMRGLRR
jgi:acyl carrier protein